MKVFDLRFVAVFQMNDRSRFIHSHQTSIFSCYLLQPSCRFCRLLFSFLPISQEKDIFECHFATAHDHAISPMLVPLGINTHQPSSQKELETVLHQSFQQGGLHCIEVHTNRQENLLAHKALSESIFSILKSEPS